MLRIQKHKLFKHKKPVNKHPKKVQNKEPKQPVVNKQLKKHDVIFDIGHLQLLMQTDNIINTVPNYINKFFFRYGDNIFYDSGEQFQLLTRLSAEHRIPQNFEKSVKLVDNGKEYTKKIKLSSYFGHELFLMTPEAKLIIDYNKDYKFIGTEYIRGFEVEYSYLNMKKDLPRDYLKPIKMSDDVNTGVELFFNHIKEVLCSGYEHEYTIVTRFLASSCAGHKLKFCLIVQTLQEQAGKGTVFNYMAELLGKRMYKTSSCEEVVSYTKNFEGCTLINLDEVPVSGSIKHFQDSMKSLVSEEKFYCRAMHQQGYPQDNTFNLILTSNNNCVMLTQSNNVRYYIPTCSNKYAGNKHKAYFDKLYSYIKREDVKIAIFQKFMKIYEEDIKPTDWKFPESNNTEAGKVKIIEALPRIVKYIKTAYLLKGNNIDKSCAGLLEEYIHNNPSDKPSSTTFGYNLGLLNIVAKRVKNKSFDGRRYIMSYADLKQNFINKNWLLDEELEDLQIMEEKDEQYAKLGFKIVDISEVEDLDVQINDTEEEIQIDYEQLYKEQIEKNKQMESKIQELKSNRIVLKNVEFEEFLIDATIQKPINIYHKITPTKKQPITDYDDELGDDLILFKTLKSN